METLTIALGVIVVILVSLGLALLSNKAEEKEVKKPKKQPKTDSTKKKKKSSNKVVKNQVAFKAHGGEDEDVDRTMLEFLRGTEEFKLKEARDEKMKKARADKKHLEQVAATNKKEKQPKQVVVADSDEGEVEYVLIKRKKPTDNKPETTETKKSKKKADSKVAPVGVVVAPEKGGKLGKGKGKNFFKKETLLALKNPIQGEAPVEEETGRKGKKGGKPTENVEAVQNQEVKKTEGGEVVEPKRRRNVGPRQYQEGENVEGGEQRERAFRPPKPREAPLPPPKPMGGPYEAASLDDMLSAISTHYGAKPKKENFFSKLPARVVYSILHKLNVRDLVALSKVNAYLNKFCRDDKLWRFFFEQDFKAKLAPGKKRIKNIYKEEYLKTHPAKKA